MNKTQPARPTAGTAGELGTSRTGNAVARRGDLVVIHLRHRDRKGGQPASTTSSGPARFIRAGLVRLYRPAGTFSWATFAGLPPGRFPLIAAHAAQMAAGDGEERFRFALDVVIDGMLARAARP